MVPERQLRPVDGDPGEGEQDTSMLCFAAVHYLLNARRIPLGGDLVTAAELKGGKLFFAAGAHSPDFRMLEEAFSTSPHTVEQAAETLGGRGVAHGDAAVDVRLPLRLSGNGGGTFHLDDIALERARRSRAATGERGLAVPPGRRRPRPAGPPYAPARVRASGRHGARRRHSR